jgi:hypothetical protein
MPGQWFPDLLVVRIRVTQLDDRKISTERGRASASKIQLAGLSSGWPVMVMYTRGI